MSLSTNVGTSCLEVGGRLQAKGEMNAGITEASLATHAWSKQEARERLNPELLSTANTKLDWVLVSMARPLKNTEAEST